MESPERFDRQKPEMGPREYGPDVGVNPGEIPGKERQKEVPTPAMREVWEKIKNDSDWVPPKPGEDEEGKKGPTIN